MANRCKRCGYSPITGSMCDQCVMAQPIPYMLAVAVFVFGIAVTLAVIK